MTEALALLAALLLIAIFVSKSFIRQQLPRQHPIPADAEKPEPRQAPDLSHVPSQFVVFDLETTGLSPRQHEIIEIGAIRITTTSSIHKSFQVFVKPRRPIPKHITRITGISQAIVDAEGVELEEAITAFASFIGKLPLVAYNASFDMAFLQESAKRCNVVIKNPVTCALQMARMAWPGRGSYRLKDLAKDGGLPIDHSHRALEDCKRTAIAYSAAATKLGQQSATPL